MAKETLVLLICTLFSCAFAASFPFNRPAHAESGQSSLPQCQQSPEAGLCLAYFQRFFYNASTGKCHNFVFGGCSGNLNNFFTEEECIKTCGGNKEDAPKIESESLENHNVAAASASAVVQASDQNVCSLPEDPGLCYALFEKYFFNGEKCVTFNFGGCGGNKNNFQTEEECIKACPPKSQRK